MLPEEKEGRSDSLPAAKWTLPDFMIPFAHPLHPLDFFYYDVSEESGKAEVAWARFLLKRENNLFIGMNISNKDEKSVFLRWDKGRQVMVNISPKGLTYRSDYRFFPCRG